MKKYIFLILIFLLILNMGRFLDLTNAPPNKSNIIVVLGGGEDARIKKGVELYKKNYSKSQKILFTGKTLCDTVLPNLNKLKYLKTHDIKTLNIIQIDEKQISNTMEELIEVKKYLLANNLNSVLFVSHPTHSRRIQILANTIAEYDEANIKISFAAADHTKVWNKNSYYFKLASIKLVFLETLKIPYNLIKYTIIL